MPWITGFNPSDPAESRKREAQPARRRRCVSGAWNERAPRRDVVIHFIWRVKKDLSEPMVYAAILGTLLLVRVVAGLRRRGQTRGGAGTAVAAGMTK